MQRSCCTKNRLTIGYETKTVAISVVLIPHFEHAVRCGGYMGYPPSKLKVYLFSYLVL